MTPPTHGRSRWRAASRRRRGSCSPPSASSPPTRCPPFRAGTVFAGRPITRRAGRTRRSISPASASASSAPAPPPSRRSPRSPSRPSSSPSSSAGRTGRRRCTIPRSARQEMEEIKSRYDEIYAHCAQTPSWFIHQADPRKTLDVPPEEREAFWEKLYAEPGFGIWMGNFRDILIDEKANALHQRIRCQEDPPARQGSEDRRQADPQGPRLRHAPRAAGERLFRGLQPRQRRAGRHQGRRADRVHHAEGRQDDQARTRVRHPDLCHRLRRRDRCVRSHRSSRAEWHPPEGCLGRRAAAHLSRHARGWLSQHADGARAAYGARQHPAGHRAQRRTSRPACCAS